MFIRLKRPIESYNKIWLATISLAITAALTAAIVVTSRLSLGETSYQAEFAQAASIRPGDQVTIAGIHVGNVVSLKLAGDHVTVRFKVANSVHLGADTRAAIKLTTLLGSRYLQLSPAGTADLPNRTIPLANTAVPYDLQKTLADATTTFEQVDADRIAESMSTVAQSLNGVPEALPQALDNLKSLAELISARRDQIGTLLASTNTLTAMIRDQQADLGSLVMQGRDIVGELVSRRAAVEQLFASATTLVDRIRAILADEPAINEMQTSVAQFTRLLAAHDALLRNIMQVLPIPMRNLANVTGSGTAIDMNFPAGFLVDSWMCAISGRAEQFGLPQYFQDCQ